MWAPPPAAAQTRAAPAEIKRPAYQVRAFVFTVLAKAAIAIEVGRSRWQGEPGFSESSLSAEGR